MIKYDIFEDKDSYGRVLALKENWHPSLIQIIVNEKISTLRLSEYLGWGDSDLNFVSHLSSIVGLEVYSSKKIDLYPIEKLKNLKFLSVQCKSLRTVNISGLGNLEVLKLNSSSKLSGFDVLSNLVHLNVIQYKFDDLNYIANLSKLLRLQLTSSCLRSLNGIEKMANLKILDLYNCSNLIDTSSLKVCEKLESIEIDNCKNVHHIFDDLNFKKLKMLKIDNCGRVDSIKNISSAEELVIFSFNGSTCVSDGMVSILGNLEHLEDLQFKDRNHYDDTNFKLSLRLNIG
jgi:hypothetical protein